MAEPSPHADRLALHQDWRDRLGALCDEMEEHFGPAGENNPDPLDAATHVAFYVARHAAGFWEHRVTAPAPDDFWMPDDA